MAGRLRRPGDAALPGGRERLHRGDDRWPGRAAGDHLRRDQGPHPGDRPVGAGPQGRLVVLRPDGRGQAVPGPLPACRPARGEHATGHRRRRAAAGRRDPAGRQRGSRGLAVLLARRVPGQPGRAAARLLHRLRRRRTLHTAGQGPGHRADHGGRDPRHVLRLRLVRRRLRAVLHHRGRGLAAVPGVAAPGGHPGHRRRGRDRGSRPAVLRRRRADPQPALPDHRHLQPADQ